MVQSIATAAGLNDKYHQERYSGNVEKLKLILNPSNPYNFVAENVLNNNMYPSVQDTIPYLQQGGQTMYSAVEARLTPQKSIQRLAAILELIQMVDHLEDLLSVLSDKQLVRIAYDDKSKHLFKNLRDLVLCGNVRAVGSDFFNKGSYFEVTYEIRTLLASLSGEQLFSVLSHDELFEKMAGLAKTHSYNIPKVMPLVSAEDLVCSQKLDNLDRLLQAWHHWWTASEYSRTGDWKLKESDVTDLLSFPLTELEESEIRTLGNMEPDDRKLLDAFKQDSQRLKDILNLKEWKSFLPQRDSDHQIRGSVGANVGVDLVLSALVGEKWKDQSDLYFNVRQIFVFEYMKLFGDYGAGMAQIAARCFLEQLRQHTPDEMPEFDHNLVIEHKDGLNRKAKKALVSKGNLFDVVSMAIGSSEHARMVNKVIFENENYFLHYKDAARKDAKSNWRNTITLQPDLSWDEVVEANGIKWLPDTVDLENRMWADRVVAITRGEFDHMLNKTQKYIDVQEETDDGWIIVRSEPGYNHGSRYLRLKKEWVMINLIN